MGFVGKNLAESLGCIQDGKDRVHKIKGLVKPDGSYHPADLEIVPYDIHSSQAELESGLQGL